MIPPSQVLIIANVRRKTNNIGLNISSRCPFKKRREQYVYLPKSFIYTKENSL